MLWLFDTDTGYSVAVAGNEAILISNVTSTIMVDNGTLTDNGARTYNLNWGPQIDVNLS